MPVKGKARLGLLPSFDDLAKKRCCVDNCVMMALTHRTLLEEWRKRARKGQVEARRVIAEMLTPSACARKNCYTFVTAVTGCSRTTVVQVNQQMLQTGGNREPPIHGLRKYHDNNKKKEASSTLTPIQTMMSEMQTNILDKQREQLQQLQQQVSEQQQQLQQQQSLQQQLLQQTLASQQRESQTTQNVLLLQQISNHLNIQIQNTQRGLQQTLHNMGLLMGTSSSVNQSQDHTGNAIVVSQNTDNQGQMVQEKKNSSGKSKSKTSQSKPGQTLKEPPQTGSQSTEGSSLQPLNQMQISSTDSVIRLNNFNAATSQVMLTPTSMALVSQPSNVTNQGQQLIHAPQQIVQTQQQIFQTPQQIYVTKQPNYQFSLMTSQANQNVFTVQPNAVMATQDHLTNETENRVYNVTLPVQEVNSQQLIVLENLPVSHHGNKLAEVLSNVQVVDMILPSSVENMRNVNNSGQHCMPMMETGGAKSQNNSGITTTVGSAALQFNKDQSSRVQITNKGHRSNKSNKTNIGNMSNSSEFTSSQRALDSQNNVYSQSKKTNQGTDLSVSIQDSSPPNMTIITQPLDSFQTSNQTKTLVSNTASIAPIVSSASKIKFPVNIPGMGQQHMYTAVQLVNQNLLNQSNNSSQRTVNERINQSMSKNVNNKSNNKSCGSPEDGSSDSLVSKPKGKNFEKTKQIENLPALIQSTKELTRLTEIEKKRKPVRKSTGSVRTPTITSEYMNFSLPLSDVISMYSNTSKEGERNLPPEQTTHLQLSLQINPVPPEGHDTGLKSNAWNLGSIVIMDQEEVQQTQNLIPKTITDNYENFSQNFENVKGQMSLNDSDLKTRQLVIDEGEFSGKSLPYASSDEHLTDTDEEVQDILQTSNRGKSQTAQKCEDSTTPIIRSNTLPFQPMERSDTLIIDQSLTSSGTLKPSREMDRSDTVILPETESPEMLIPPQRTQKVKKKVRKTFKTGQITPNSGGKITENQHSSSINSDEHVIITGNLNRKDQSWIKKIVHDIQKQK